MLSLQAELEKLSNLKVNMNSLSPFFHMRGHSNTIKPNGLLTKLWLYAAFDVKPQLQPQNVSRWRGRTPLGMRGFCFSFF